MYGGGVFYATFRAYKFLWLKGRTGGGKTSLAYALALTLLKDGLIEEIYANIPGVSSVPSASDIPENCCIIIDEGGLFLKKSADFEATCAMLRKLNNYVIIASVIPPAREFAMLSVQRTINLARLIGVNFWLYQWQLNYDYVREKGNFMWTNPMAVFGLYDTDAPPVDDAGIADWIQSYIKNVKGKSYAKIQTSRSIREDQPSSLAARKARNSDASVDLLATDGQGDENAARFVQSIDNAGDAMGQASSGIENAAARIEAAAARLAARRKR